MIVKRRRVTRRYSRPTCREPCELSRHVYNLNNVRFLTNDKQTFLSLQGDTKSFDLLRLHFFKEDNSNKKKS